MVESNDRRSRRSKSASASQRAAGTKLATGAAAGPPATPATTLADAIAGRLVEQGLVGHERQDEVAKGLVTGTLDAGSWRVLAEITLEAAARSAKP